MSLPWMPLYIADYRRDTGHLSAAEHGAYLLLIMHYWSTGGLPDDDLKLCRISCMTPKEWKRARPTIEALFQPGWKHKRIEFEITDSQRLSIAGRIGGKASAEARKLRKSKQNQQGIATIVENRTMNRSNDRGNDSPTVGQRSGKPLHSHSHTKNPASESVHSAAREEFERPPFGCQEASQQPPNSQSPSKSSQAEPAEVSPARWLRSDIVKAYQSVDYESKTAKPLPDTSRAETWIAQGYDAQICAAVVRECLANKPTISTLKYFDNPIKEAHEKRAASGQATPSNGEAKPQFTEDEKRRLNERWWHRELEFLRRNGIWRKPDLAGAIPADFAEQWWRDNPPIEIGPKRAGSAQ